MTDSTSAGDKTNEERVTKIHNPTRVQIRIEEGTYVRTLHAAVDRRERGISKIVEEALRLWLKTHTRERAES